MSENNLYNNLHVRVARWYTANSNSGEPWLAINSSHSITNSVLIDRPLKCRDKCRLWPVYTRFYWDFPRLPNGSTNTLVSVFSLPPSLLPFFFFLPPSSPLLPSPPLHFLAAWSCSLPSFSLPIDGDHLLCFFKKTNTKINTTYPVSFSCSS